MTNGNLGSGICTFDGYQTEQTHQPWMTLNCYKSKFSLNFALVRMFERQQRLNEWRSTCIVCDGIVWKYFITMYKLRWYCWAFLSEVWFCELCPTYQGCPVLTFALARLSCTTILHTSWQNNHFRKKWIALLKCKPCKAFYTYLSWLRVWD